MVRTTAPGSATPVETALSVGVLSGTTSDELKIVLRFREFFYHIAQSIDSMALQLGRTFSDGISRVLTRTGGILLVTLIAIQLLIQSSINTAVVRLFPEGPAGELEAMLGLTLPVSGTGASILFVGTLVLSSSYFVVVSRALTRSVAELSTFPSELYTRRMGPATLSMLVGGIVVGLTIVSGMFLFILPGIFLSICFLFFIFAVGVEDRGVLSGLKRSWALSRGNRLKLALLVVLAGVIGVVIGTVSTLFDLANSPVVGELISNTLSSVLFVFLYGLMASAYLQVRDDQFGRNGRTGTAEPLGSSGTANQ